MSLSIVAALVSLILLGYWLYNLFRHPISKLKNSLDVLLAHGTDGAWIQFHHHPSDAKLTFVKEIVGGVPSLIYVNRNALDAQRLEQLKAIVQNYPAARITTNFQREKRAGKVHFGRDVDAAFSFANEIAGKIHFLGQWSRFSFEIEGFQMPPSRRTP